MFKLGLDKIKKNPLIKDSFWALLGNIIIKGLGLFAGIIVARILGKEIFGEYGMIKNTLTSIAVFSTFGLGYTATKYIAEYSNKKENYISQIITNSYKITLLTSVIMALGLLIFSSYISNSILHNPNMVFPLRFTAVWIVFNALNSTQIAILSGFGKFKQMARVNSLIGIITFLLTVLLTYFFNLNGALLALIIAQVFNWFLFNRIIRELNGEYSIKDRAFNEKLNFKSMIKFSFPVALQEGVFSLSSWLLALLIVKLSDYGELGVYVAALQWLTIVLFVPAVLRNVILSHLTSNIDMENEYSKTLKTLLFFNFLITFIPFLIIYAFSDFIISFYGESFADMKGIFALAVMGAIPLSLINVYIQALISKNGNWLVFVLKLLSFIFIIVCSYFLITSDVNGRASYYVFLSSIIVNSIYLLVLALLYNRYYK